MFSFLVWNNQLLYYEHGVDEIPEEILSEFSEKDVTHVDFSSNSLVSLNCRLNGYGYVSRSLTDYVILCRHFTFLELGRSHL